MLSLFLVVGGLLSVSILGFKHNSSVAKCGWMPYECGFQGISNLMMSYSTEFYMVVFCFMFLDLEILLVLPFIMMGSEAVYLMVFSLLLLMIIFMYEKYQSSFYFGSV